MFNDFVHWFVVSSFTEILGSLIIIAIGIGLVYILYEVVKPFVDMYIQSKLVELYKQKDRLWEGYQDLYDSYEDLKEKTWDYDITKKKLHLLSKDVVALEEYVLGDGDEPKKDSVIQGVIHDFDWEEISYGKYLYDKVKDEMCHVVGWDYYGDNKSLILRYDSDNYISCVNLSINNLWDFKKRFYLTVSQEPNAAGYVKEYIQEHLGINNKEK